MTPERIAELRALCQSAEAGPWKWDGDDASIDGPLGGPVCHLAEHASMHTIARRGEFFSHGSAAFIAAARTALPEALDEIERFRSIPPDGETWQAIDAFADASYARAGGGEEEHEKMNAADLAARAAVVRLEESLRAEIERLRSRERTDAMVEHAMRFATLPEDSVAETLKAEVERLTTKLSVLSADYDAVLERAKAAEMLLEQFRGPHCQCLERTLDGPVRCEIHDGGEEQEKP